MQKNLKTLLPLFLIVGIFIIVGAIMINSGVLPEESARDFRTLANVTIQSDVRVLQQPTPENNLFVYAINDVAQRGIDIAQSDPRVREILDEAKNRKAAITIAAIQPVVMVDRKTGESDYSPAGQVMITANWQTIDGNLYLEPMALDQLEGKKISSHQQIWNVLVDVDKTRVTNISQLADRIITDTIRANVVRTDLNMFMPNIISIEQGSTIQWPNLSNLPHNVVGAFDQASKSDNSTGISPTTPDNSTSVVINSGFIKTGNSWQYRFDNVGAFNYICTIHSEEGMRGTIIVTPS